MLRFFPIRLFVAASVAGAALVAAMQNGASAKDARPDIERAGQAASAWSAYLDAIAADRVDVVFLGERHDNEHHHRLQSKATAGLGRRFAAQKGVAALVFEMIPFAKEPAANKARGWPAAADAAQSRAVAEAVDWARLGWPDFALYAPILEAAPAAYIGGGGYPRGALMRSASSPDWLSKEPNAARFGLDQPLPKAQQAGREQAQIVSHCNAIPASVAPMMVDAQRARDARLAEAILRARAAARGEGRMGPVVVITGSGHARRDFGAPALLARAAPELKIVSLAFVEPGEGDAATLAAKFDAWARTPPPIEPRGDPCEAFKNRKKKPAQ